MKSSLIGLIALVVLIGTSQLTAQENANQEHESMRTEHEGAAADHQKGWLSLEK